MSNHDQAAALWLIIGCFVWIGAATLVVAFFRGAHQAEDAYYARQRSAGMGDPTIVPERELS